MTQIGINDKTVFIPGTKAKAGEVNANFANIINAHNETDSRVGTLEANPSLRPDGSIPSTAPQSYKKTAVTGATNATPIVITSIAHGKKTGDKICITGVLGNLAANGTFIDTVVDGDHFSIKKLDGTDVVGNGAYISGGTVYLIPQNNEDLVSRIYVDSKPSGVTLFDNRGTLTQNITLLANTIAMVNNAGTFSLSLPDVTDKENQVTCVVNFTTNNADYPSISNTKIKWGSGTGGKKPKFSILSGVRNILIFKTLWIDDVLWWTIDYDTKGAIEMPFVQPSLSANGTLGSAVDLAVYLSLPSSGGDAYLGADNNSGTRTKSGYVNQFHTWYSQKALKLSSIYFDMVAGGNEYFNGHTLYASNNNTDFKPLMSGVNSSSTYTLGIPEANRDFYYFYKLFVTSCGNGSQIWGWTQANLNGVYLG